MKKGQKNKTTKNTNSSILIALLLFAILLISGCSGLLGDNRGQCSEGKSCQYYTGSRGIITQQESPPKILYYYTSLADQTSQDGNTAEFSVRVRNDGASDAYGAVYISGFAPELFRLYKVEKTGDVPILIDKASSSCFFDITNVGSNIGNMFGFVVGCAGNSLTVGQGGTWGLDLNLKRLGQIFGREWPDIGVNLQNLGNGNYNLGFSMDGILINTLNHGALLMGLVTNFNFETYGGTILAMKGDNEDSPGGDIDYKTFKVRMIGNWPAGQDFFEIPYQIKTCYAYTTFVSPMICVDPNPFSEEKKVCRAETYKWGGSQGGPVAVTSLVQTNTGKEVIMDITIKNVGPGKVWDVGYLESCSPYFPGKVTASMHNVVYIGQAWIGDYLVDCTRNYKIRLDPNTQSASFTCRYDIRDAGDIGSAYAIPLKMELWYGYEEIINNQIRIRRLA